MAVFMAWETGGYWWILRSWVDDRYYCRLLKPGAFPVDMWRTDYNVISHEIRLVVMQTEICGTAPRGVIIFFLPPCMFDSLLVS
jgi:hypothetical protein